jgi:hypothetical protein
MFVVRFDVDCGRHLIDGNWREMEMGDREVNEPFW